MSQLVSYAQIAEDVVLWRALGRRGTGFFVDVGAHHPVGSSVTKLFSNVGWRGINIEPITHLNDLFRDDRPNDVNLAVGISDTRGELEFFDVVGDQQRSTFDPILGEMYRAEGRTVVSHQIPVITLSDVFEEHVVTEVDFLKIDAEGHEGAVIRSLDFGRWRPHVVLAEGVNIDGVEWPQILRSHGYQPALFDGVNRFYFAEEHSLELREALSYPACPLDNYVSYDHLLEVNSLRDECARLADEVATLRATLSEVNASAPKAAGRWTGRVSRRGTT